MRRPTLGLRIAAVVAAAIAIINAAPAATATPGSADYPAALAAAAPGTLTDPWGFANRESTSFVAWRLTADNHLGFAADLTGPNGVKGHFGDATSWPATAKAIGYGGLSSTPAMGAVAWWGASSAYPKGHVAWVKAVNGDGSIEVEEYDGLAASPKSYDSRRIAAGRTWPGGFLHLRDIVTRQALQRRVLSSDINGDGAADLLYVTASADASGAHTWMVQYGATGGWTVLGTSDADPNRLFLGDLNGDKKADVLYVTPGVDANGAHAWMVRYGATGDWQTIGSSSTDPDRMFLADINGDKKADVFYVTAGATSEGLHSWLVKYGAVGAWAKLGTSTADPTRMFFANLDNNARADLFYVTVGVNSAGAHTWLVMNDTSGDWSNAGTSSTDPNRMFLQDIDGSGRADVFYETVSAAPGGAHSWLYRKDNKGPWRKLGTSTTDINRTFFGDINKDRAEELFYVTAGSTSTGAHSWLVRDWSKNAWRTVGSSATDPSRLLMG